MSRVAQPCRTLITLSLAVAMIAGMLASFGTPRASAAGVVGNGTPASCTDAALNTALSGGGDISFNCGPEPLTIIVTAKTINSDTVINGGGVITLYGSLANRILAIAGGVTSVLRNIVLTAGSSTTLG